MTNNIPSEAEQRILLGRKRETSCITTEQLEMGDVNIILTVSLHIIDFDILCALRISRHES